MGYRVQVVDYDATERRFYGIHDLPARYEDEPRRWQNGEFDRPALFDIDRYGTIFAANRGPNAESGLRPRDIPRWLEFISRRCS